PLDSLPPELQRIVRKCLRKNREERYQSAGDVAIDLRDSLRESQPQQERRRKRAAMSIAVAGLALVVIGLAWWLSSKRQPAARAGSVASKPAQPMLRVTNGGNVPEGAISPGGKYVVYATLEGANQARRDRQVATG